MSPGVWLATGWMAEPPLGGKDCRSQNGSALGNVISDLSPNSGFRVARTGGGWRGRKLFLDGYLVEFHLWVMDR